jgi:hypothetical protein
MEKVKDGDEGRVILAFQCKDNDGDDCLISLTTNENYQSDTDISILYPYKLLINYKAHLIGKL